MIKSLLLVVPLLLNFIITHCENVETNDKEVLNFQFPRYAVYTSNRPRSPLTARRLNYNFNDLVVEALYKPNTSSPVIEIGTGYPNYLPPKYLLDALVEVAQNQTQIDSWTIHQYTTPMGDPRLRQSVAKFFSMLMNRNIDPDREVLITVGAQHALESAIRAYLDPGDECIIFEPAYFNYDPLIRLSNAVPVYIPLRPRKGTNGRYSQDWTFDPKELERQISPKTKMILINNPNNPYGKIYTREELTIIGQIAEKHNLIIVSDEVEQFLIYDEPQHIRIATLPGLFKRVITITSAGKVFANTGWRLGWSIGPEELLWGPTVVVSQEVACVATPLQLAFAKALDMEYQLYNTSESFLRWFQDASRQTRNELAVILKSIGTEVIVPAGGYSIVANFASLVLSGQINLSNETDPRPGFKMANWLLHNAGIDGLAASVFYSPKDYRKTNYLMRFIIIKTERLVNEFGRRLFKLFGHFKQSEQLLPLVNSLAPEE